MKFLLSAIALAIAVPAAAQTTAPAANPPGMPADHSQHQERQRGSTGHDGHADCCGHESADGKKMDCCDKAKAGAGKMECCDKMAKKGGADAHAGHDMSKH
jgi:hypothetical protein